MDKTREAILAIGGFILGGADNSPDMIIRAIGPSLSNLAVSNALSDPTLELRDGKWDVDRVRRQLAGQSGSSCTNHSRRSRTANGLEAVIAATIPPGPYTAIIAGKNGTVGVGLVEIYNLQ